MSRSKHGSQECINNVTDYSVVKFADPHRGQTLLPSQMAGIQKHVLREPPNNLMNQSDFPPIPDKYQYLGSLPGIFDGGAYRQVPQTWPAANETVKSSEPARDTKMVCEKQTGWPEDFAQRLKKLEKAYLNQGNDERGTVAVAQYPESASASRENTASSELGQQAKPETRGVIPERDDDLEVVGVVMDDDDDVAMARCSDPLGQTTDSGLGDSIPSALLKTSANVRIQDIEEDDRGLESEEEAEPPTSQKNTVASNSRAVSDATFAGALTSKLNDHLRKDIKCEVEQMDEDEAYATLENTGESTASTKTSRTDEIFKKLMDGKFRPTPASPLRPSDRRPECASAVPEPKREKPDLGQFREPAGSDGDEADCDERYSVTSWGAEEFEGAEGNDEPEKLMTRVVDSTNTISFDIRLPEEYSPDLQDQVSRAASTPENYCHTIEVSGQNALIAATRMTAKQSERVVIKRYDVTQFNDYDYGKTMRELMLCRALNHHHIVRYVTSFWEEDADHKPIFFYVVRERMDFSLDKYYAHISKQDGSPKERLRDHRLLSALLVQILKALLYLEEQDITHREIQPRAVGVNQNGFLIKLIDFGCVKKVDNALNRIDPSRDYIYQAPELLAGEQHDRKVDIWSTAATAVEMLGVKLFYPAGWTPQSIKQDVLKRIYHVCAPAMMEQYPQRRSEPTARTRLPSELPQKRLENGRGPLTIQNLVKLLERMFTIDPKLRPSAAECLKEEYLQLMNTKYDEVHKQPTSEESFHAFIRKIRADADPIEPP